MSNAIFGIAASLTPGVGQGLVWDGRKYEPGTQSATISAAFLTGLTLNRIPFGTSPGGLQDSANLTFDGSSLSLVGTAAVTKLDSGTFSQPVVLSVGHTTSGTATTGFGCELDITAHSASGTVRNQAAITTTWTDATDATRKASASLYAYDTTAREGIRLSANGSAAILSLAPTTGRVLVGTTTDDGATLLQVSGALKTFTISTTGAVSSTSTSTGDLILAGGAGIAGALWVGGLANITGSITSATTIKSGLDAGLGAFAINGAAGNDREVNFQTASSNRWRLRCNSTAEGGANAGSDFQILARSDTGTAIDSPIQIIRAAGGLMTISRPLQVSSNLALFATGSFGSGTNVVFIANASVNPSTNPTGGGVLYCDAGALKYRGSSGTVTTLGPA